MGESNSGQAGVIKGSAVGAAGSAAIGGDGAHETPVFKGHHGFANHVRGAGWAKDSRATRLARAGIDVEVRIEFRVFGFLIFETPEVLFHVRQRTEQSFFFAAPKSNANSSARLDVEGREDPHCFEHHRRADAVVGCAGGVVPGVVVASEHDDFIFLVRAGNFSNGVIGGGAFGVLLVLNVYAEGDGGTVGDEAGDAAVVFVTHDECGDGAGPIVGPVLLGNDDAVSAACIVDANECTVV